jgi:hypothetical protein
MVDIERRGRALGAGGAVASRIAVVHIGRAVNVGYVVSCERLAHGGEIVHLIQGVNGRRKILSDKRKGKSVEFGCRFLARGVTDAAPASLRE